MYVLTYVRMYLQDYAAVDSKCPEYVRKGFSMMDSLVAEGETGMYVCMYVCM